jgi:hypothetical protein
MLRAAGDPMHEAGKLRPYSFVARANDTTTPDPSSQSVCKELAEKTTPLKVPGVLKLLSASAT